MRTIERKEQGIYEGFGRVFHRSVLRRVNTARVVHHKYDIELARTTKSRQVDTRYLYPEIASKHLVLVGDRLGVLGWVCLWVYPVDKVLPVLRTVPAKAGYGKINHPGILEVVLGFCQVTTDIIPGNRVTGEAPWLMK